MFLYPILLTIFIILTCKLLLNYLSPTKKIKKQKKKKKAVIPDQILSSEILSTLPDEILTEIFTRVSAKSVGKFRCLSKTWYAILSTSSFIDLHLSRNTHEHSLILTTPTNSLRVINSPVENYTNSTMLELRNTWTSVIGSCNGLVLLLNSEKEMFLVNPTTLELFKVSDLTVDGWNKRCIVELRGFGYGSSIHDYKILLISRSYSAKFSLVYLYSVKSGVWKSISHSPFQFSVCGNSRGAFTNGSIHWFFSRQNSLGILAFNLATEIFYEVDVPLNFPRQATTFSLFVRNECLCTVNSNWKWDGGICRPDGKIKVWIMEGYGNVNSWTELGCVDSNRKWFKHVPLYFSSDEEIVLVTNKVTMVVCDLQEETVTDMVVDGAPASFRDGCSFVGSLVSIKGIIQEETVCVNGVLWIA